MNEEVVTKRMIKLSRVGYEISWNPQPDYRLVAVVTWCQVTIVVLLLLCIIVSEGYYCVCALFQ